MFGFWDWVGGRYSMDSAIGLSTMLAIGPEHFTELLAGFHEMDEHFRTAPLRAQPAGRSSGCSPSGTSTSSARGRFGVMPYDQYLKRFPAYLQQLTMESNGKHVTTAGEDVDYATGAVYWGEPGTNGQHSFYQLLHQGTEVVPVDLIAFAQSAQRARQPPRPAHLERLRPGPWRSPSARRADEVRAEGTPERVVAHRVMQGNRPSNVLLAERLTPRSLGSLIALYEHSVFTQGAIWGIDSFDQWGVELGKQLASQIAPELEAARGARARPRLVDEHPHPPLPVDEIGGAHMTTTAPMQLGMVGLGRMGANLVRRLTRDGHHCVAYDRTTDAVAALVAEGVEGAGSLAELVGKLERPRAVWLMLPAAVTGAALDELAALLDHDDVVIDGGNSYYRDDIARAAALTPKGLHYVDCGTSGGVFGLERGVLPHDRWASATWSPASTPSSSRSPRARRASQPTPARTRADSTAPGRLPALRSERGRPLREDGPQRHRVRDDGRHRRGAQHPRARRRRDAIAHRADAETDPAARSRPPTPTTSTSPRSPSCGAAARSSARGWSISPPTRSRAPRSSTSSPAGSRTRGRGAGRCSPRSTSRVPAPVITASLFSRFESRGEGAFADKLLSAMRSEFGGHAERPA